MLIKSLAAIAFAFAASSAAQAACNPDLEIVDIAIKDMKFVPAEVEICLGQTVRWTSLESATAMPIIRHTVTFNPAHARVATNVSLPEGVEIFESGALAPAQTYEHEFTVLGEYKYICRPHEMMGHLGKITVVDPTTTDE